MQETIDFVFERTGEKIDYSTLEELSNVNQLIPVFLFSGHVGCRVDGVIVYEKMKAYFTHDDFFMHKTKNYQSYSMYGDCDAPEWIEIDTPFTIQRILKQQMTIHKVFDEVFLFTQTPTPEIGKLDAIKLSTIDFDDVRFERNQLLGLFSNANKLKESPKKADDKSTLAPSELGEYQKLLITYELFTPEKIACLLTDSNPAYNHNNDNYNARLDMVSNAIDAGKLNYINSKDEISAEQIKMWLKNNKIVFEGFNDDLSLEQSIQVSQLQKRIDDLESQLSKFQTAAPDVVSIPFGKRIDLINKDLPQDERLKESYQIYSNDFSFHEDKHPVNTPDEMIERIQGLLKVIKRKDSKILELEKQTNAPAHAQAEIDELKEQLNKANAELVAAKTATTAQPFDWQNMSEHIYPPELHLAIMIWQRIYVDNELKEKHIPSHNGKASAIARKIGLNPKSTLFNRVAMIINTAKSKNEQASLAEPLRAIEQLYMPPRKEKTTS